MDSCCIFCQNKQGVEYEGMFPIKQAMDYLADGGYKNEITLWMGQSSQTPAYETSMTNVFNCWITLLVFAALVIAAIFLKRIDKDKR